MSNLNMSIGSTIKDRRIALNIKQDDLADQVGVTVQTMSKWERDLTEPKASQVYKLSKALKVSEKEICMGESVTTDVMNPMDFARDAGKMIQEMPELELLINIYDHVEDKEGFLIDLYKSTSEGFKAISETHVELHKHHVEQEIKMIESGEMSFVNEDSKQKYLNKLRNDLTIDAKPKWMQES